MFKARFWRNFDWWLFGAVLLLTGIGVLVLYATAFQSSAGGVPVDTRNQIVFALIGLVAMFLVANIDYRVWRQFTPILYAVALILLVMVEVVGTKALGATRWISLGFFQFQPSELVKLVLIIVLAKFLSKHYDAMRRPGFLLASLAYTVVPMVLVLAQPDLGTGIVLVVIWLSMVLASRVRLAHLVVMALLAISLLPLGLQFLQPYQRARLGTFLNPTADPLGSGYNVVQSTIAVGSGQWFGRGLAAGSQSQLNFLPSQHTDFIFAVLAEKMGFVGSILLLLIFAFLLLRAILIAYRAQDRFGMLLSVGISAMLLFHLFINVGMNLGILPVTGIPLPFVSYGGTSLLVAMISIGILESVAIRHKKIQFTD